MTNKNRLSEEDQELSRYLRSRRAKDDEGWRAMVLAHLQRLGDTEAGKKRIAAAVKRFASGTKLKRLKKNVRFTLELFEYAIVPRVLFLKGELALVAE